MRYVTQEEREELRRIVEASGFEAALEAIAVLVVDFCPNICKGQEIAAELDRIGSACHRSIDVPLSKPRP